MYTVIGHPRSRTLRVIWALEEMGLDYELRPATPRSPEVLALNPWGKIPILLADGEAITDSVAILTYLADRHGALTHPAGSLERARQDALTNTIIAELDAALWTYAKHSFVLPEARRVEAVKDTAKWEFTRALEHLETARAGKPFLAGDFLTIPDILISHCAGWALRIKFPLPGAAAGDYLKSLRKRPAMQRAFAQVEAHS